MAKWRSGWVTIWSMVGVAGCAPLHPDYMSPPASVPQAVLDIREVPSPLVVVDGRSYSTAHAPVAQRVRIAANDPITVLSDFSSGTGSCRPNLTFTPNEGETYVVKHVVRDGVCRLELETGDGKKLQMEELGRPRFTLRRPHFIDDQKAP